MHRDGLQRLTITGSGAFPWQVDGDHLGDATHLEILHEPRALTLVVP
ncbi:MAG: hypothetical protein M5T61_02615 [Acidimicrobiia bacterium]|nr:hypothetical protein [Acidimicrobiia bacterium]